MILSCQNIEKAFLEKQVLKNCSFHIEDYEKAAIVGLNGAGQTTLAAHHRRTARARRRRSRLCKGQDLRLSGAGQRRQQRQYN